MSLNRTIPSLPEYAGSQANKKRQFDLLLARTDYNYMFSYMEPLPLAASVPKHEEFTPDYFIKVLKAFWELADNFVDVVGELLIKELSDDYSIEELKVMRTFLRLSKDLKVAALNNQYSEITHLFAQWLKAFVKVPPAIVRQFFSGNKRLPKELFMMLKGLVEVFNQFRDEGFTAFLKSTLFDMLDYGDGREYLTAKTLADYQKLYNDAPLPLALTIEAKSWMQDYRADQVWDQDWYLGYIQIAGFNTTNLKAVRNDDKSLHDSIDLTSLLEKMPLTDEQFKAISGVHLSLKEAADKGLLFACDYSMLEGIEGGILNGKIRYPVAPIGLFFGTKSHQQAIQITVLCNRLLYKSINSMTKKKTLFLRL